MLGWFRVGEARALLAVLLLAQVSALALSQPEEGWLTIGGDFSRSWAYPDDIGPALQLSHRENLRCLGRFIAVVKGRILVSCGSRILCLGAGYEEEWEYRDVSSITGIAASSGKVYVATLSGYVRALSLSDGRELWSYNTMKRRVLTPVVAGGVAVFPTAGGTIYALSESTGSLAWVYRVGSPVAVPPTLSGGVVVVGDVEGMVYALNVSTGRLLWARSCGAAITTMMPASDSEVFVAAGSTVHCVEVASGRELWSYDVGGRVESASLPENLVVATRRGRVVSLTPGGVPAWQCDLGVEPASPILAAGSYLYLVLVNRSLVRVELGSGRAVGVTEAEAGVELAVADKKLYMLSRAVSYTHLTLPTTERV